MRIPGHEELIQQYISMFNISGFLNGELLGKLQLFQFPAYTNIYLEQDEQTFLFFLVKGQVQCTHYNMNGKPAVFALLNPFNAIGDIEIMSKKGMNSNVITSKATTMLGISKAAVQRYGTDDPLFLRFIISQLQTKLYNSNSLQRGNVLSVRSRLALYILAQVSEHEENIVVLPDKESLASLLGTTQRHLNRVIKELKDSRAITFEKYPSINPNRIILQSIIEN